MPRHTTFPDLYDECKTISIAFLKQNGYLGPDQWRYGNITWSRGEGSNKRITGSIGIWVSTKDNDFYLELDYKCNDKPIKYKVPLVTRPSNIGKGVVWFFRCPNTGKLCRKLYLIDTYFLHRTAFRGAMYEKQTYSKHARQQAKLWGRLFDSDKVYEEVYSKHFKKQYAGKLALFVLLD
jgi:hypothetical protein